MKRAQLSLLYARWLVARWLPLGGRAHEQCGVRYAVYIMQSLQLNVGEKMICGGSNGSPRIREYSMIAATPEQGVSSAE
jgi:hypothetical protein